MGPLFTDEVLARTIEHVEDAVAKGARIVYGGGHEGRFHEPTILDGVTSDMTIAKEETFGPVAPIMTFASTVVCCAGSHPMRSRQSRPTRGRATSASSRTGSTVR